MHHTEWRRTSRNIETDSERQKVSVFSAWCCSIFSSNLRRSSEYCQSPGMNPTLITARTGPFCSTWIESTLPTIFCTWGNCVVPFWTSVKSGSGAFCTCRTRVPFWAKTFPFRVIEGIRIVEPGALKWAETKSDQQSVSDTTSCTPEKLPVVTVTESFRETETGEAGSAGVPGRTVNFCDAVPVFAGRAWPDHFKLPSGQLYSISVPKGRTRSRSLGKRPWLNWNIGRGTRGLNFESCCTVDLSLVPRNAETCPRRSKRRRRTVKPAYIGVRRRHD